MFAKAQGKYDGYVMPGYLEPIINILKTNDVGTVYMHCLWYDDEIEIKATEAKIWWSKFNIQMTRIISALLKRFAKTKFFTETMCFYKVSQWDLLKGSFKAIGSSCSVDYPFIIRNPQYISMGNNFSSLYNLRIEAWDQYAGASFLPEIIIGDNVCLNTDVHIACIYKVVIGNGVLMGSRIYISDHSHGEINREALILPPLQRHLFSKGPVIIEDNVWIGEGVCIMPGVTIGRNSIIGANSVVTKSVPGNSVIAGIPARVIKTLAD